MAPDYLYKYTPLSAPGKRNRQQQLDTLLTKAELWLAEPVSFNDPMDCKPRFQFAEATQEQLEKFRNTVIKHKLLEDHPKVVADELKRLHVEYLNKYPIV